MKVLCWCATSPQVHPPRCMGGGHLHPKHIDPKLLECKRVGSAYRATGVPHDPLVEENALFRGGNIPNCMHAMACKGGNRAREAPHDPLVEENALFRGRNIPNSRCMYQLWRGAIGAGITQRASRWRRTRCSEVGISHVSHLCKNC